eukprot:gene12766-13992_t
MKTNESYRKTERIELLRDDSSKSSNSNSNDYKNSKNSMNQCSKKRKFVKIEDNPRSIYYLPRIPRNDVRRQYAMMFSNVYNSHDWDYMSKFVQTFFHPNVSILFQKYADESKFNEVECKGSENALQVWYDAIADVPDLIFNLEKTRIKVRTDGTAVISSTFHVQGTIIDDLVLPKSAIFEEIDKQLGPELFRKSDHVISKEFTNSVDDASKVSSNDDLITSHTASTNSYSDFDKEFEIALNEYLNEDSTIEEVDDDDEVELQRFYPSSSSSSSSLIRKVFQCSGHFSLHFNAESIVHYGTYSIFSTKILS